MPAINELIDKLKSEEKWETRRECAVMLGDSKDPSIVPQLIEVLTSDPNENVREEAAWALNKLAEIKSADTVKIAEGLTRFIKDPSKLVRAGVAATLGKCGTEGIKHLVQILSDDSVEVRRHASEALISSGAAALPALKERLLEGNEPGCSESGILLARLGKPAVPLLLEGLESANAYVRERSAFALGKIRDLQSLSPMIKHLKDENVEVRRTVALALGELGSPQALEPLMGCFKDADDVVKLNATTAVAKINDTKKVENLAEALKDPDENVRVSAIDFLAKMEYVKVESYLMEALKDRSAEVRRKAVVVLGKIANKSLAGRLMELATDSSAEVREAIANALGKFKDPQAVPVLINLLKDENPQVKSSAIWALGIIGDPSALEPLTELLGTSSDELISENVKNAIARFKPEAVEERLMNALKNPSETVRMDAAESLTLLSGPKAITPLMGALKDSSVYVRKKIVQCLGTICKKPDPATQGIITEKSKCVPADKLNEVVTAFCRLIKDDEAVRELVIATLGEIKSPHSVDSILTALSDKTGSVRVVSARVLGEMREVRAIPNLIEALKDSDAKVRDSAALALERIGDPCIPGVRECLSSPLPSVREIAVTLLAHLRSRADLAAIINLLKDANPSIRLAVCEALRRFRYPEVMAPLKEASQSDPAEAVRKKAEEVLGILQALNTGDAKQDLFKCPKCGYFISKPTVSNSSYQILIMLGVLLSVFLIGIPLLLLGLKMKSQAGFWSCRKCGTRTPVRFFD